MGADHALSEINRVTMGHNPIRRDCQVPALPDVISPPKRWWELVIASVPSPLPTLASNTLNSPILHDPVGGVPTMGVPPNHPKLDHLSIETYGFGVPPWLRKPPVVSAVFKAFPSISIVPMSNPEWSWFLGGLFPSKHYDSPHVRWLNHLKFQCNPMKIIHAML